MHWNGKIIGALIGFFLANIPGALVGLFLGHLYDKGIFYEYLGNPNGGNRHYGQHTHVQYAFFKITFAIMGYIAKSDGHVTEREIAAARQVMQQMHLHGDAKNDAIKQFYHGKSPDFNLDHALYDLKQTCRSNPMLLRTFIEVQTYIAQANGTMTPQKRRVLEHICHELGIRGFNFDAYQNQQRQSYQRSGYQSYQEPRHSMKDAYELLEIKSSATDAEVKKAYRRMMSKNHPDKLIAQGLPPSMIKIATQKTQQIKEAYEAIKRNRGNTHHS